MKDGWQSSTLAETCEMYQPKTISGKEMVEGGEYPVFGANGIIGRYDKFNHEDPQLLITCRGATCGSVNISEPRSWITGNAMVVRPKDAVIDMRFLEYLFRGGIDISKAITGAAQPQITRTNLGPLEIRYPESLAEQRRIVGILDEAFEGIATAKANAEKNLQNARALFDTFLNTVYLGRGADAWPKRRLGDVFEIGSSKRIHERDWSPAGVPFYGGKEIVKLAKFGHAVSNAYISEQKYHEYASKYDMPKPGDILITARGTIGVGYIVQKSDKFYYKDGNIISMRAKEAADPHYLLYAFRSTALAAQLGDLSGATVTHLPLAKAKELLLRMPDMDMQNATAQRIIEFENETQRLESIYQRKLAALDDLKKSLLHQAFSGEL